MNPFAVYRRHQARQRLQDQLTKVEAALVSTGVTVREIQFLHHMKCGVHADPDVRLRSLQTLLETGYRGATGLVLRELSRATACEPLSDKVLSDVDALCHLLYEGLPMGHWQPQGENSPPD